MQKPQACPEIQTAATKGDRPPRETEAGRKTRLEPPVTGGSTVVPVNERPENIEQRNIISGVALTALAAAAGRAVESARPDRLITDPLATAFVTAAHSPIPLPIRWPAPDAVLSDQEVLLLHGAGYIGLRSRFCDDYLHHVCADGIRQVVMLAAGLDTRAFRLDWPAGTRLFEIDQPTVLEFKNSVLREKAPAPQCARTTVGVDLRHNWADTLTESGFEPSRPSVWIAEGLLQYLPTDAEQALFEQINALSANGSYLVVERTANLASLTNGDRLREISERTGIPMDQLIDTQTRPDPATWLAEHGWTVTTEPVTTIAQRYHRDLAAQPTPTGPVSAFLCASR
jgi:methyltransferase (TIGR00027 family)